MTFAKNINRICAERGTNLTTIVKEVKGSSSFTSAINKGSLPKETEMVEMANMLGCTVMDFFADVGNPRTKALVFDEDTCDILRIYYSLSRREKHEFMSMVYNFDHQEDDEDDLETTATY